jgi:16S rRNA (guanine527-N7)-methyltransferase
MKLLHDYFPDLTEQQLHSFDRLEGLYKEWNAKINVISRKDESNFYERHVLHSLGISKVIRFNPGSNILDIGTGGGFPGIPLAILHPDTQFTLIDSIGKKIKVVNEVVEALGLQNVETIHGRAENTKGKYDFIVSRAVTSMPLFLSWTRGKFKQENRHNELKNGILYLKGGELSEELSSIKYPIHIFNLSDYFKEDFFETKKVVYIQMNK